MPPDIPTTQLDRSQIDEELARAEMGIQIALQSEDMNHLGRSIKRKNELIAEKKIIMRDEPAQIHKIIENAGKRGVKLEDAMNPKKNPGQMRQTTIMVPKKTAPKSAIRPIAGSSARKGVPSSGLRRIFNGRIKKSFKKTKPIGTDGTPFLLKGPPR